MSFLSVEDSSETCLSCGDLFKTKGKVAIFKDEGWISLKQQAEKWSKIKLSSENSRFNSTLVFSKVADTSKALRVRQRLIRKRHFFKGYKEWWIDAGVNAAGSADKAEEAGHSYRNMRLHKESFSALVQLRVEAITSNFIGILPELIEQFQQLQTDPCPKYLQNAINNELFIKLYRNVMRVEKGSECFMIVAYLKDVSALLALVSAVGEGDFERH